MSMQIIKAFPERSRIPVPDEKGQVLNVSEFYWGTIQGEGFYIGYPAVFLRLQGCILNCSYCDSTEVWRAGNPYSFDELFQMIEKHNLIPKFKEGTHLVITGGSPLLQQSNLVGFFKEFKRRSNGFLPFIEVENECVITPSPELIYCVSCWNNSPKLSSSGISKKARYRPDIIKKMSRITPLSWSIDSWFKFVIGEEEDWEEILIDFLDPELIRKNQIILMPLGATRQELYRNQKMVAELAIKHNVKYCSREHIVLWNKNVGV